MKIALLLLTMLLAQPATELPVRGTTPSDLITQGKLAMDLGDPRSALKALSSLVADAAAPERVRAEALVRLGAVQRALGKTQSSTAAFQKAMLSPARDAEVTRLLALALGGVAPDRRIWASQWRKVRLGSQSGTADSHPYIQWPGPGPQGVREAFPAGDPPTLDLESVPLNAFLHHFLVAWEPGVQSNRSWPGPKREPGFETWPEPYRPPAAVQGLDFVIHSGVRGDLTDELSETRVTVKTSGTPWNEVFENVLASNGLGFTLDKNRLFVARIEDLGAFERVRSRIYGGPPISLNFLNGDIRDVLGLFSDITGFRLVPDSDLRASVTLVVSERPALEVFDLMLAANDLAAARIDAPSGKPGTTALRIQRLAVVGGDAVDVSRLVIMPPLSASFASFEGVVQVQRVGAHEWIAARSGMPLSPGDLVRTGPGACADIGFGDGTPLRLRADSLITIEARPPARGFVARDPSPTVSRCRP